MKLSRPLVPCGRSGAGPLPGAVLWVQHVHTVLVLVWHSLSVQVSQRSGGMGGLHDVLRLDCFRQYGNPAW